MKKTRETRSSTNAALRLAIAEDMTIYNALTQKQQLLDTLASCEQLEIDLSAVGEIDTAGLQLLILAKREAGQLGKSVVITAHSPAVREMLDFFNMATYFGDPLVIPARERA